MLSRQVITYASLLKQGLNETEIKNLSAGLKLFPTPFKGIYYVPGEEERRGKFIDNPGRTLYRAAKLYLNSDDYYFSCRTAEEHYAIKWQPIGHVHIVNEKISKTIDLKKRIEQNRKKTTWRAKNTAGLLSLYGNKIIFHKVKSIEGAKFKRTPYGAYALRSQIRKDKKRFREKMD